MQKGASNAELKKNASRDDDFGKDFFDSWKSAKLGNDLMDFDLDTVPKNNKASFKFDELDNFELSGNFEKLSSFKLDVPDLDFAALSKKNENTHEKFSKRITLGKKESKENKFSFDFDFNSFDLGSKSLVDEGPSNLSDKKVPEQSSKHEANQESSDNISTSNIISKEVSTGKGASVAEDNEKNSSVTMVHREHSHGKYLPTENSSNNQDFCLQTSSEEGSAALLGIQTDNAPRTEKERKNPVQQICSSPSKSSIPVDSYNSGYWTNPSGKELLNPVDELQKHQSKDPLTRITGSFTDSLQIRKELYGAIGSKKSIVKVMNIDEKKNPCQNIILPHSQTAHQNLMRPPLKREFTYGGSTKLHGLVNTGLQLHTISELENNIPQQSPAFISKPFKSMMEARTKRTCTSTSNDSSLELQPSSASHKTSIDVKSMAEPSLEKLSTNGTVVPKSPSIAYNTIFVKEKSEPKLVSSTRLGSHIIKTNKNASLGDNNYRGTLHSVIAKTIEVNNNKTISSKPSEAKSVRYLEKRIDSALNAANPVNIEKHVSLHTPLKRKIDEESVAAMESSSPSKFVKQSTANRRISFEASQNTNGKMVPEINITDTCKDIMPVANLTSVIASPEAGSLVAGFSSNLEDDDLRNAENFMKGLDNICSILRKKQAEAKELQVRSIINNNTLLLLNYSMLEENIQALQKSTSNLLYGNVKNNNPFMLENSFCQ